ncbi:MAG TPA: SurA N-terminal domain-containing protein, partial [Candidatus Angelobacter sp.]
MCLLGAALALTGCPNKGPGDTMAKVNGYKIQRSEVDKAFTKQTAGTPQKLTSEQEQNLRLQILQQLITLQLYLQKAEKLGVVATDDEIETKLNQAKAPYTKEEFAKSLQDVGATEDDYKQDIRRKLTIEKLFNKEIASKVTISNSDIQT